MTDANEMKKVKNKMRKKKRLIDGRISSLRDTLWHYALWYGYDEINIAYNYTWLDIFVRQDERIAKVSVTYEALTKTDYTTLMDEIKEAINVSFEGGQDK